jgi:hypothetical protein
MNCRGIALLLSERLDHGLPFWRNAAIRIHLALCVFCRRLKHQLDIIAQLSRRIGCAGDGSTFEGCQILDAALSPDAKSRMKEALDREKPRRKIL